MNPLMVFFAGARDDSYTARDGKKVERFMADVYLPGTGAFSFPVSATVYAGLLNTPPMVTQFKLPVRLEVVQRVMKSESGAAYARSELAVRFGDLERMEETKRAG